MMKTIVNPIRLPRKLKKEVIKRWGRKVYRQILRGELMVQPKKESPINDYEVLKILNN